MAKNTAESTLGDEKISRHSHSIWSHGNPRFGKLEQLSTRLQTALQRKSYREIKKLREELNKISIGLPHDLVENPLEHLDPVPSLDFDELSTRAGIYLFSSEKQHYVGLTENFRIRFHIPLYGHLTDRNNSRSRHVQAAGDWGKDWNVYFLETYDDSESASLEVFSMLSSDEIFWYYFLKNHPSFTLVNREENIGKTSETNGYPVISFCSESGVYNIHPSIGSASRATNVSGGNLSRHVFRVATAKNGHVRSLKTRASVTPSRNYIFRFANDAEVALLSSENAQSKDLQETISQSVSDCALVQLDHGGDKFARLVWNQGEFNEDIDILRRRTSAI